MTSKPPKETQRPLLDEARDARESSDWVRCVSKATGAIQRLGARPSDDWISARLIMGSAVASGELESKQEAALERVSEAIVAMHGTSDDRIGAAHRILGHLFESRHIGIESVNLTLAIHHFERSFSRYSREAAPEDWAHAKVAIALCLKLRLVAWAREGCAIRDHGDYEYRRDDATTALKIVGDALSVFNKDDFPDENRETRGIESGLALLLTKLPGNGE